MTEQRSLYHAFDGNFCQEAMGSPTEEQPAVERPIPIEVKMGLPAWMLRDPGPLVDIEDDDVAFEEGT